MYGLVQLVIISYDVLNENLRLCGFAPEKITQVVLTHKYLYIHLVLVVDDFGIKYTKKQDA